MQESIDSALRSEVPEDLISRVKTAVIEELTSLDSAAEIENTGYFNHTFIPDLVLNWRDGGRKEKRDIFLRFSLRATVTGGDVAALSGGSPVVLALRENTDSQDLQSIERGIGRTSNLLVTDVPALASISNYSANAGQAEARTSQLSMGQSSPLLALVRSNFVKGARGFLTTETTETLRLRTAVEGPEGELQGLRDFSDTVQRIFAAPVAIRLERAAQLMEIGLTGNFEPLEELESDDIDEDPYSLVKGQLSQGELRVLLPYLLSNPRVTGDPRFWLHVGSMLNLEDLENISLEIQGMDLTRLVGPNASRWMATRAAYAFNVTPDVAAVHQRWEFRAHLLNLILGDLRVMVSTDRRRIKGRDDNVPARWGDLSGSLEAFHLTAVTLDGLNRNVRVAGENDTDIYRDVQTITSSIQDEFHVPEVEVATSDVEGAPRIVADFRSMMATANAPAPIASLVSVVTKILGYRNAQRLDGLDGSPELT
jgi:hypothetical protein